MQRKPKRDLVKQQPLPRRSARAKQRLLRIPQRIQSLFHNACCPAVLKPNMTMLRRDPGFLYINNFLSESELAYFDAVCTKFEGRFSRSYTQDSNMLECISEERTSRNLQLCKSQDAFVRRIEQRAADLVGISSIGVEPMQIVSYKSGQQFKLHHDAGTLRGDGTVDVENPCRLVTFFVYLNSLPEGEGHTEFPHLALSVQPKQGCAILFSNVQINGEADIRLIHRANPISKGLVKYGLNIWICETNENLQYLSSATPKRTVSQVEIGAIRKRGEASAFAQAANRSKLFVAACSPGPK